MHRLDSFLAQVALPDVVTSNFGWIALGVIVLAGLAFGAGDWVRLSPYRVWAIASVGFRESIRRRVLWITPLAMLGIVAVTQLAHPTDEQDAVRQATKYCLFATGVVVVVAVLILACTNLPKEIENRVIYTIVTKPATRLEIVLGKTLGFAGTSAAILLIMGVFSYAYLRVNAGQLHASVRARLAAMGPGDIGRETLQHYADDGLLQARTYARPDALDVYAEAPRPGDKYRWAFGSQEQNVLFPVRLPAAVFDREDTQLVLNLNLAVRQRALARHEGDADAASDAGATTRPTTQGAERFPGPARVTVSVISEKTDHHVAPAELMDGMHLLQANRADSFKNANDVVLEPPSRAPGESEGRSAVIVVAPKAMAKLKEIPPQADGYRHVFVVVAGLSPGTRYGYADGSLKVEAMQRDAAGQPLPPQEITRTGTGGGLLHPVFRGRLSTTANQQLRGAADRDQAPVAVYRFRGAEIAGGSDDVPLEFRTKIERSGAEATEDENVTHVEIVFENRKTGFTSPPITITADSDRPTFFGAPRKAMEGGDFDLLVRSRTEGHFVGLRDGSIAVVASTQTFAGNLAKSLLILWMLSVLVVVVSIFTSTFVSWPIAVVLTLVILLGHWCVMQLDDPATPQSIYTDLFGDKGGAVEAKLFTTSLAALNKLLHGVASVLPDMSQFRVTEDIERGVTISGRTMWDAVRTLGAFGIPLVVLAYLFLRKKEVAP